MIPLIGRKGKTLSLDNLPHQIGLPAPSRVRVFVFHQTRGSPLVGQQNAPAILLSPLKVFP